MFLKDLKDVCKATLPTRTPELKIGCQIFRKTFYVVGVFGQAGEYELKNSARHKSVQNSLLTYLPQICHHNDGLQHSPKTAQSHQTKCPNGNHSWLIRPDQTSGNTMLLASMGGSKILPITDVPNIFVHTILRVPRHSPATSL